MKNAQKEILLKAIDKADLTETERERLTRFLAGDERALRKRDKALGLRFASEDIARWQASAEKAGVAFSDWVEDALNALVMRSQ